MSDDLWTQIEEAYTAAARLPKESRRSFLNERYGDRPEIVQEVESLLEYQEAGSKLRPSIALQSTVALVAGDNDVLIGRVVAGKYRIRRQLGATAMNEVYLADHIVLGVPFALKRPAPSLGSDSEFRLRLLEEGR